MGQTKPKIDSKQIEEALDRKQNGAYGFIYVITNLINGKKYCGQKAYGCDSHWKSYLGSGTQIVLAVEKYGKQNFSRDIIEYAYSKEELNELEIKWIAYYNAAFDNNWYNIGLGGQTNCCRGEASGNAVLTDLQVKEIIQRLINGEFPVDIAKDYDISPSIIGRIRNHKSWTHLTEGIDFEINHKMHSPVVQYDFSGKIVNRYPTVQAAANAVGVFQGVISGACNGEYKTAAGYIWKHEKDAVDKISEEELSTLTTRKPSSRVKQVCQYDLNGKFVQRFENCVEAAKAIGVKGRHIAAVVSGNKKTAYGYIWKAFDGSIEDLSYDEVEYYTTRDDVRRVVQYDFNGVKIKEYRSATKASKETGIRYQGICNACDGKYKQSGGYLWRYIDDAPDFIPKSEVEALLERKESPLTKEICQFDLYGNLVRIHHSLTCAANEYSTTAAAIQSACVGHVKTSHGFVWRYRDKLVDDSLSKDELKIIRSRKVSTKMTSPVKQFDMNNILIAEFSSIREASRLTGIGSDSISHVCRGVNKTAGGYRWEYGNRLV